MGAGSVLDVGCGTGTLLGRAREAGHSGRLRFLDPAALAGFLEEAGFGVEQQFGDWEGGPLSGASEEIVTIARRR
jgi:ubiquinone/menaquinone biosynthesis C-methylase UbiE